MQIALTTPGGSGSQRSPHRTRPGRRKDRTMKLYTHSMSSSARRVNVTVAHLGISIDQRMIDLRSPADRAELVAVNPNNKIPVLVDPANALTLWESHSIMQYLCDREPARGAELYPTELVARADV